MSTRESFLISPIKSIQRGSVTATNGSTGTVTVTSVDTSKSVLHINIKGGATGNAGVGANQSTLAGMVLTDATTLTWTGGTAMGATETSPTLNWQLVEYK